MNVRGRLAVRAAVPAVCAALAVIGGAALSRSLASRTPKAPPAMVIPVKSSEVRRVAVEGGDRRVELARARDGSWTGGSPEAEGLMSGIEERLFPLQAYRTLRADTSSPEFGLGDPEITFLVEDLEGRDHEVALGAATFANGGVYARESTDTRRLYLVPRRMMDDLRSLVAGRRIDAPNDLPDKVRDRSPKYDPTSWWLRQALDATTAAPGGPQ